MYRNTKGNNNTSGVIIIESINIRDNTEFRTHKDAESNSVR